MNNDKEQNDEILTKGYVPQSDLDEWDRVCAKFREYYKDKEVIKC